MAEKIQEIDRLKVEMDTLKKTAEENLNVSTDNKVRRLKNICQKMENESSDTFLKTTNKFDRLKN